MENRVIVFDVDGTLLPSNNALSDEYISFLHKLEDKNIVCLASSRGYHDLVNVHDKLGLKGPIISNNGGSLNFFDETPSVTLSINPSDIKEIFKTNKDVILSTFYSYKNKLFIYNKLEKLNFLYKINENSVVIEGEFDKLNLENPNSIYFILDNNKKNIFFNDLKRYKEINVFEYGHDLNNSIVILTLKNTDKAYAILELLLILNKKESDLIIFGDGEIDISMLQLNGITVAMSNAPDEVKNSAKYVTRFDNNHGGVFDFLMNYKI